MRAIASLPASVSVRSRGAQRALTPSAEDHLARIYELTAAKGYARGCDIAAALGISGPSVTTMVQHLNHKGYLRYEKYRGLTLTSKGTDTARRQLQRRTVLTEFFTRLGLDARNVARDVEGLEHYLSEAGVEKLERLLQTWRPPNEPAAASQLHPTSS